MQTWLSVDPDSDFSIHNLPFGIFSTKDNDRRAGLAIGNFIVDLSALKALGSLDMITDIKVLQSESLNELISLGKSITRALRNEVQTLLCQEGILKQNPQVLVEMNQSRMHMPVEVGDYTDFYSSRDHATNVGKMFRDPENALLPNWLHIPVGYHGRSSSIVVSGESLKRPKGQILPKGQSSPIYSACRLLDFELEMAFIIGKDSVLGDPLSTDTAGDHIFGMLLFNDWSARDIQKWEYVPLGPFLGKNWGSSVSPWIVTMDALEPFKIAGPVQKPEVLPYLKCSQNHHYDIDLSVSILTPDQTETTICRSNYKHMYWNMVQQLAHHTVNGCNVRVGDMMASGTISGPEESSFGSMLELSWAGSREINLLNGETRKFIKDHDTVIMGGHAKKDGMRIGFGEVRTQILPAD